MRPVLFCLCLLALTSCSAGNAGIYPGPTRVPAITNIIMPDGPLVHDAVVEFVVEWDDGLSPFRVAWDFGAGGNPSIVTSGAFENNHTADVAMVNETGAPVTYECTVVVEDDFLACSTETFTFTVEPSA